MPTYVYKFVDTGETIEVQQAFTDDALIEHPHPSDGKPRAVKKVFTPVGVTFKGSGFYKTDSRKGSGTGGGSTKSDSAAASTTSGSSGDGSSTAGSGSDGGTSSGTGASTTTSDKPGAAAATTAPASNPGKATSTD
ncbi:MAG: FmdB family transcriptional regulator [Ilumatobacteraceae bacterium]|nr:MAG: FmdB family transcriptional regulator [Actinomycetota bacterium]